jgi:hypothetical protein
MAPRRRKHVHSLETILSGIAVMEEQMQVPAGTFLALRDDSDWACIIKLHALIEGAVSTVLATTLDPRLKRAFERLPLSDRDVGKVVFASQLGLLSDGHAKFVRMLSELRNRLVHNPRNMTFTLKAYIESLDRNQQRTFVSTLQQAIDVDDSAATPSAADYLEQPKVYILSVATVVIAVCVKATVRVERAAVRRRRQRIKTELRLVQNEVERRDVAKEESST